jgi:hypothetical protein
MAFLVKQPSNSQSALTDSEPRSSYSEAETIPLGFGQDYFASQWLCDAYHRRTAPAGSNQPEHQYASIAAKFRKGPIVYVGAIKRDGKVINNLDYVFGEDEDEHTFTIQPNMKGGYSWQLVLRRGTETQTAPTALRTATGQNHPPYKGDVWGEWINIPLGQGTTAIPDLQLELRADVPEIGAFGGGAHTYYGANPIAVIYAWAMEQAGGLGASADVFDPQHWGAQAVALEAVGVGGRTGSLTGIHPTLTAPRSAGALFSDILSYFDGYLYADGGQLKVGWFPNQTINPASVPEISEADLVDAPGGNGFSDWNTAPVSASVVFTEQGRFYLKAAASSPAPVNSETGSLASVIRKDRPWIHTREQAAIMAAELSASDGNDDSGVSLNVLTSRLDAAGAVPGALFRWDYAPHTMDLLCRVISRRTRAGSASETITVIRERGAFPTPYVGVADERVPAPAPEPGVVTAGDVRLWLVPPGLRGEAPAVAVLINRGKLEITTATIALSATGAEPWADVQTQSYWAAKCAVAISVNATAATLRVTSTSVDMAAMEAQNAVAQADDALLLVVGDEVLSVGSITVVDANTYDLGGLRGRRGSLPAAHAAGDVAWLVRRSELAVIAHQEFQRTNDTSGVYSATVATKHFKIALSTAQQIGDYAPANPGLSLTLPSLAPSGLTLVSGNASIEPGTALPRLIASWTAPSDPTLREHGFTRVQWRQAITERWATWALVPATQEEVVILGAILGQEYYVAIRTELRGSVSEWIEAGPHLMLGDTEPPDAPSGLTATAGTGAVISLAWSAVAGAAEYRVYRGTSSNTATMTAIGDVAGTRFVDVNVSVPATYYYAIKAQDDPDNASGFSNVASATTQEIDTGGIDTSSPSNPSAPTLASSGVKVAGDGTVTAKLVINVPALPSLAVLLNILYRQAGAAGWTVADQIDEDRRAITSTTTIDDLATNTSTEVAVQAFSAYGYASAIVTATGSPFTTPNKTSPPAGPTGFSITAGNVGDRVPPAVYRSGALLYACTVSFSESTARDLAFYETGVTTTPSIPPFTVDEYGTAYPCPKGQQFFWIYRIAPIDPNEWAWIRSVDTTGNRGDWVLIGNVSSYLVQPDVGTSSSRRYKTKIRTATNALATVKRLRGVWYDRRDGTARHVPGLIAEETVKVVPAVVIRDERRRPNAIDYPPLVGLLVEAVKQQDREFRGSVRALERKLARLERLVSRRRK